MKPNGLLLCSQENATWFHTEPNEISLNIQSCFLKVHQVKWCIYLVLNLNISF
jgi:hypothetical protein